MESSLLSLFSQVGGYLYLLVPCLLLLATVGLPAPEELILFLCGYAIQHRLVQAELIVPVCFLGILMADTLVYGYGRLLGEKFIRKLPSRIILPGQALFRIEDYFQRYGSWTIFLARFISGFRYATFLSAGISRMKLAKVWPADLAANLIFTPAVIYLGYRLAYKFDKAVMIMDKISHVGILLIPLVIFTVSLLMIRRSRQQEPEHGGK